MEWAFIVLLQDEVVGDGGAHLMDCSKQVANGAKLLVLMGVDVVLALDGVRPLLCAICT